LAFAVDGSHLARLLTEPTKGMYAWPDGSFRNVAPPNVQLAEIVRDCAALGG